MGLITTAVAAKHGAYAHGEIGVREGASLVHVRSLGLVDIGQAVAEHDAITEAREVDGGEGAATSEGRAGDGDNWGRREVRAAKRTDTLHERGRVAIPDTSTSTSTPICVRISVAVPVIHEAPSDDRDNVGRGPDHNGTS